VAPVLLALCSWLLWYDLSQRNGCRLWLQYLSFVSPVSSICRSSLVAPVMAVAPVSSPVVHGCLRYLPLAPAAVVCGSSICCSNGGSSICFIVCGSSISCRSCLQYLSLVAPLVVGSSSICCSGCGSSSIFCRFVLAPVSVVSSSCGSSISCRAFVAPVSPVVRDSGTCRSCTPGSSICCLVLCLQYLLIACGSSLQSLSVVASVVVYLLWFVVSPPVSSVVHGSGISCRSCLLRCRLSFMAPVSPVVRVSSGVVCRSWLQYLLSFVSPRPVVSVVRGSSIICHLVLWLRQWLKYYLLSLPVAPSCRSWLLWLSSLLVLWLL